MFNFSAKKFQKKMKLMGSRFFSFSFCFFLILTSMFITFSFIQNKDNLNAHRSDFKQNLISKDFYNKKPTTSLNEINHINCETLSQAPDNQRDSSLAKKAERLICAFRDSENEKKTLYQMRTLFLKELKIDNTFYHFEKIKNFNFHKNINLFNDSDLRYEIMELLKNNITFDDILQAIEKEKETRHQILINEFTSEKSFLKSFKKNSLKSIFINKQKLVFFELLKVNWTNNTLRNDSLKKPSIKKELEALYPFVNNKDQVQKFKIAFDLFENNQKKSYWVAFSLWIFISLIIVFLCFFYLFFNKKHKKIQKVKIFLLMIFILLCLSFSFFFVAYPFSKILLFLSDHMLKLILIPIILLFYVKYSLRYFLHWLRS